MSQPTEWRWLRGRRKPYDTAQDVETATAEGEPEGVGVRVFAKRQALLHALVADPDLMTKAQIAARHVMTRELALVSPRTPVKRIAALMAEQEIHHALVCEAENQLVGVISDRDLRSRPGKTAQLIMTPRPISVEPDTPLAIAITCLIYRKISCLPVVEQGRVCGLVTTTDLALVAQCALHLWLRLANALGTEPVGTKKLARLAKLVDAELSQQHACARQLTEAIDRLTACSDHKLCRTIPASVEEILTATERVKDLLGEVQEEFEEHARRGAGVYDNRTDPLTGLSNRHGLDETLRTMWSMRQRYRQPFSVVVLTLEPAAVHSGGNTSGELDPDVLRAAGRLILADVRETDVIARHRPDGFAIVLPQTELGGAAVASRRLRQTVAESLLCVGEFQIRVGFASASAVQDSAELLPQAEEALAAAESTPGECVVSEVGEGAGARSL